MTAVTFVELKATLVAQHQHIKQLMQDVRGGTGPAKATAFHDLCGFLAAHEAAEEATLHRWGAEDLAGDATVVARRLAEEKEAGQVISRLELLGADAPEFDKKFEELCHAIIAHARAEEHEELPLVCTAASQEQVARIHATLQRVPEIAARQARSGMTFHDLVRGATGALSDDAATKA